MSVIIRLQNLPWSANALDIRQFFHGLSIPEGGVHIVGGEQGDAFIAFSTDEDARQAFNRTNGKIKEVQITLMLSSRTEMQKVIEAARTQSFAAFMPPQAPVPPILPAAVPELKKPEPKTSSSSSGEKRRRSRSRSRDRRRRHRSRSRERRRRRSRSRSRDRKRRSKRTTSSDDTLKKGAAAVAPAPPPKKYPENVWADPVILPQSNFIPPLNALNPLNPQNADFNMLAIRPNHNLPWPEFEPNFQNNGFPINGQLVNNRRFQQPAFGTPEMPDFDVALPDTCVKLAPFYGGYGDIRRFFQGSFISNVGIKFINDEFGHRTGLVYVQFGHPQGKVDALRRSGEVLNGVKVDVGHIDDREFNEAIDRFQPENFQANDSPKFRSKNITKYFNKGSQEPDYGEFSCLIVDDLPTYCKEQDILKMFSPRPLVALFLVSKSRGAGHIAYVKFGSCDEAKKALEEKSAHIVEGKSVTVKVCDDRDFQIISEQHIIDLDPPEKPKVNPAPRSDTDCINVTLLPLQTNQIEITDFFSDVGVRPHKIHMMSNRLGFTGQAFCEFKTLEDATKALKKDGATFGDNVVTVQAIPRALMEHIVKQTPQGPPPLLGGPHGRMAAGQVQAPRPFLLRSTYDGRGGAGGFRFGGRFGGPRPRFANGNGGGEDGVPAGYSVFMDNVPYKAGTNEILDFFDGYDVSSSVSRRFNSNNTPSAEAKVVFNSIDEAFRAVQERNGATIWDRPIFLKQV